MDITRYSTQLMQFRQELYQNFTNRADTLLEEESWWQLTHLAFAQLWLARHLTVALPRPWERSLPAMKQQLISPTLAQCGFARISTQCKISTQFQDLPESHVFRRGTFLFSAKPPDFISFVF